MFRSIEIPDDYEELSELLKNVKDEPDGVLAVQGSLTAEVKAVKKRYSYVKELTSGAMKRIDVVVDKLTGRLIARAQLKREGDLESVELFMREARISAGLSHPNIVPVYDLDFDDDGKPFFMMKLLTGDSLQKVLNELQGENSTYIEKYSLNKLLNVFLKVCDAVEYAHSNEVVHLDLKPDNIQIGPFGEVYICDWGMSKALGEDSEIFTNSDYDVGNWGTLAGVIKGTPGYMAPEQAKSNLGRKDFQTDIFSLGAILYSLLTYKPPFSEDSVKEVIRETVSEEPISWSNSKHLPYALRAVCEKALSKQKSERYETVSEFADEVRAYLDGFATKAEEAGFLSQVWLLIKRNRLVSVIVFTALLLLAISVYQIRQNEKKAVNALKQNELLQQQREELYIKYLDVQKISDKNFTQICGKWHIGKGEKMHPMSRGFDEYCGMGALNGELKGSKGNWPTELELNKKPIQVSGHKTDILTDQALKMINKDKEKPFFMFLSYFAPHTPLQAPKEEIEKANGNVYHAMIQNMDKNIGRVVEQLKKDGRYENTIIWFLSDNGGTTGAASNYPLNGQKGIKLEGGQRVPFVFSWPKQIKGGQRFDGLTSSMDIMATSYAVAGGVKTPKPLDGVNLMPYLTEEAAGSPRQTLYWRKLEGAAIRHGKWKMIRSEGLPMMLYNLETDKSELSNIAKSNPEVVKELTNKLEAWETELKEPLWREGKGWTKVREKKYIGFSNLKRVKQTLREKVQ